MVSDLIKDGCWKCPVLLGSYPSVLTGVLGFASEMAAAELEYESVLCVKPDVSVYRIPPRTSNRGYRSEGAGDWGRTAPSGPMLGTGLCAAPRVAP